MPLKLFGNTSGSHERAIERLPCVEADSQGLVQIFDAYAGNRLVSTSLAVPLNFTLLQYIGRTVS